MGGGARIRKVFRLKHASFSLAELLHKVLGLYNYHTTQRLAPECCFALSERFSCF